MFKSHQLLPREGEFPLPTGLNTKCKPHYASVPVQSCPSGQNTRKQKLFTTCRLLLYTVHVSLLHDTSKLIYYLVHVHVYRVRKTKANSDSTVECIIIYITIDLIKPQHSICIIYMHRMASSKSHSSDSVFEQSKVWAPPSRCRIPSFYCLKPSTNKTSILSLSDIEKSTPL